MTSEYGLPAKGGLEHAAARLHDVRHVVRLREEVMIELPDDACPLAPIQLCREALDGVGQPMAPLAGRVA